VRNSEQYRLRFFRTTTASPSRWSSVCVFMFTAHRFRSCHWEPTVPALHRDWGIPEAQPNSWLLVDFDPPLASFALLH
jgi:hypothetical protein